MIVVALPTIEVRGEAWKDRAQEWADRTPETVLAVPSWRPGGWAQGLNEAWELYGADAEIFVCGSDDMTPEQGWYEAMLPWVSRGIVAPQVHDPRFSRWDADTADGVITRMSSFPIIHGSFLNYIFPIRDNEPQHYCADDMISDKARLAGIETIAVPSCVITHTMDERGRGAGMGDEATRMVHDRRVYRKALGG